MPQTQHPGSFWTKNTEQFGAMYLKLLSLPGATSTKDYIILKNHIQTAISK